MTGTGGTPAKSKLLDTALEQGYRVIALSYINKPAVAQFCIGSGQTDCAEKFRDQRVFGRTHFEALPDRPHDSIVSRLTMLFRHLARHDPDGLWEAFISNGQPDWEKIVVAGHSQGGGMAAFIAKRHRTARVVVFSGGWDNRGQKGPVQPEQVAAWYSAPSATPVDQWIVAYQTRETNAASILETYRRLGVPDAQVVRFTADVPPDRAHLIPIRNAENHPTWRRMFGNGRRQ